MGRFSSQQIDMIFLIFSQKIRLNKGESLQFAWNVEFYFLGKIGKIFQMLSAEMFTQAKC